MIGEDLVKGAKGAAAHLGPFVTERIVYHLVDAGRLPVIRMGKTLYFRKSELEAAFRSEGAAA